MIFSKQEYFISKTYKVKYKKSYASNDKKLISHATSFIGGIEIVYNTKMY